MHFELSEEQRAYVASAREFAQAEFRPNAAQWDESSIFPKPALKAAGDLGFMGMYTPVDAGGLGMPRLDASLIVEELARGCTTTAAFLTIHNMATAMIISRSAATDRLATYPWEWCGRDANFWRKPRGRSP